MRSDGEWTAIYNRWLAEPLGPAPSPPKAVYGRTPVSTAASTGRERRRGEPDRAAPAGHGAGGPGPDGRRGRAHPGRWPTSTQLGRWRDERQAELDQLDQAALQSPNGAAATSDITLSMALWKAVSDRYEQLLATWDSGRVGPDRADAAGHADLGPAGRRRPPPASSVSLPEACRLSDALASQLRVRLGLEVSGAEITERIRQLRAQMERIRDQVDLEPAGAAQQQAAGQQSRLARRLKEIADKAGRGGDVGGLLGPLEIDAATFERDLIVGGARRREAAALVGRARATSAPTWRPGRRRCGRWSTECVRTRRPGPAVRGARRRAARPGAQHRRPQLEIYLRRLDQVAGR